MEEDDRAAAEKRAKEEAEYRALQEKRRKEEEEKKRRIEEDRRAEERREREEKEKRAAEERRRKKQEEEWKKLGSDKIVLLPPVPASFTDDNDPGALKGWLLDEETSKAPLKTSSLKPGKLRQPPHAITLPMLRELGIVYFRINLNDFGLVNQIVQERKYKHTDEIRVSQTCKDESFLEKWFVEHFNEDEQLRLITDGSCYLDIRSKQDTWIRLFLQAGDLVCIPPGAYHRGTLDENDYCALMRIFRDSQRWNPIMRSEKRADNHPARLTYTKWMKKNNVAAEMGYK